MFKSSRFESECVLRTSFCSVTYELIDRSHSRAGGSRSGPGGGSILNTRAFIGLAKSQNHPHMIANEREQMRTYCDFHRFDSVNATRKDKRRRIRLELWRLCATSWVRIDTSGRNDDAAMSPAGPCPAILSYDIRIQLEKGHRTGARWLSTNKIYMLDASPSHGNHLVQGLRSLLGHCVWLNPDDLPSR